MSQALELPLLVLVETLLDQKPRMQTRNTGPRVSSGAQVPFF